MRPFGDVAVGYVPLGPNAIASTGCRQASLIDAALKATGPTVQSWISDTGNISIKTSKINYLICFFDSCCRIRKSPNASMSTFQDGQIKCKFW
jgi:hypothetical protein